MYTSSSKNSHVSRDSIKKSKSSSHFKRQCAFPTSKYELQNKTNKTIRNYIDSRLSNLKPNNELENKVLGNTIGANEIKKNVNIYKKNNNTNKYVNKEPRDNNIRCIKEVKREEPCKLYKESNYIQNENNINHNNNSNAEKELLTLKEENKRLQLQILQLQELYTKSQNECETLKNKIELLLKEKQECYSNSNRIPSSEEREKNCSINSLSLSEEEN